MWTELKSDKLFISFISTILHSLSIRLYRIVDTVVDMQCNKRCLWQCCHYHYLKKINMEIGNNLIFDREKCWEKMQHERINSCYPFGMLHCTCLSQWISFVYKNVQSFWMSIFHFNEFSIFISIHLNNSKQTLTNGFQPMLWCDCFELFYHLSEESKQWEAKLSIHLNTDIHFTKTTIDFHTIEPVHFFLYLLFSLSQTWRIYRVVRFVSQLSAICLFHSALFSVFHLCPLDHNFHDTKILLIR